MDYKALSHQVYKFDDYKLVTIRKEDRYKIMQWRNEQIFHLRQAEPLTKEKQDWYFDNVVAKLFDQEQPNQILFSFLENEECIGYGGLVHINWIDRHAEISFVMNTALEDQFFETNWQNFLRLIEQVAFEDLNFHKLFTYAFDIRPHLYSVLESAGFKNEAILPEHCLFDGSFKNVVIHGKINRKLSLRRAKIEDTELTYQWAINLTVRQYALTQNEILKQEHEKWFSDKVTNSNCLYYIALCNNKSVGSFRLDINKEGTALISYLIDPTFHGKGLGKLLLKAGIEEAKTDKRITNIVGYVKDQNKASLHLFRALSFSEELQEEGLIKFQLTLK
ncbi:MAG: RimJ/RimL family protein N-acetyltransferase [Algoriphagus sp.]|jgi:RimJ/RimL family protein N-acetyltransferase